MVYFDNAATTRPCAAAVEAANIMMRENFGNPSSLHGAGLAAGAALKEARGKVAAAIGATPGEIFFTSGGTEADNWAIFSGMKANRKAGRHLVITAVEHHAALNCAAQLEKEGAEVTYIQPETDGTISAAAVLEAVRPDTALVSVMMVNNESGAVFPIAEIAAGLRAKKSGALLHTDAVQGLFKVPFTVKKLGADLISLSAHKVHGIKGAGALYIRKGLHLAPFVHGGGQESGLRSGTEPVPAIAAFAAACEQGAKDLKGDIEKMTGLRDFIAERVKTEVPGAVIYGPLQAPHILPVSVPGCPSQVLVNSLAAEGICVSAGSACSKGKRSHVLTAQRLSPNVIDGAIRASLCPENTRQEAELFVQALARAAARISGRR